MRSPKTGGDDAAVSSPLPGPTLLGRFSTSVYARQMIAILLAFTAFLGFIACDGTAGSPTPIPEPTPVLPTRTITITGGSTETLIVELATTPQERQFGLMERQSMAENRGMLFLFPEIQGEGRGFWMKNTYIPLTIAYLDSAGKVLALMDGTPLDETLLRPGVPYTAVLEVNQGWFQRHSLGVGSVVALPADAPTPQ